ncbi:kinesin-like protein KIF20B isoform X2 [Eupeodes corollae]|uniref:kinesin-like protein KIF20B isoform X2 n=1 Tax=Eupeodes corollae TaxID=290404 RepID=UPI00249091C9|nr:kinesin-like protein KIF20B isoform X2 [Eupeodes corollae]
MIKEEIILETPSSSGESEKRSESCTRKKRKTTKLGSTNSGSQIPRSNSIHRGAEFKKPIAVVEKFQDSSKSLHPYRLKKSFSQMDMKMSKNNTNYNNTSQYHSNFFHHQDNYNNYGTVALPKPVLKSKTTDSNKTDFCPSKDSSLLYLVNEPECGEFGPKLAGMKIFATIMLNSWRNRRDEVRRLKEELEQLQKKVIKVKNQVHVLSSVFRNEQKQNEKLNRQLRHASQDIQRLKSTVENLTTSLISAKADASFFEQQLHAKEQENDSLNNGIVEINSQLFKSMTQVRQLQSSLSCEQRSVQELENQKNELLNEIALAEMKWKTQEEQLMVEIYEKDAEIAKAHSDIKILETLLNDLKEKEFQVRDLKKSELKLKNEIETLKMEARDLRQELSKCLSARMKRFWTNYMDLNRNTILLIHLGAFYLLPAIPPPKSLKLPFSVSLDKVMSVIRS